jgi:hypothetical protein
MHRQFTIPPTNNKRAGFGQGGVHMTTERNRVPRTAGMQGIRGGTLAILAGLALPASATNVNILPDATFNEFITGGLGALGQSLTTPETIFDDLQQESASLTREAQAQVITTGGTVPAVDVTASSQVTNLIEGGTASGLNVSAGGDIRYAISIQPRAGVTLPSGTLLYSVPITVQAVGSVLWQGTNLSEDFVNGTALARVNYNGQNVEAYYGYGGCAATGNCVVGPGGEFDYLFTDTLTWNVGTSYADARSILLATSVNFTPYTYVFDPRQTIASNSVSVQAIADPVLAFVNPADTELFEFIVSPGITVVPIPPGAELFGSGLLAFLGAALRRRQGTACNG